MDRNSVIGLLLIGVILIWYSVFYSPSRDTATPTVTQEQTTAKKAETVKPAAPAVVDTTINEDSIKQVQANSKFGAFASAAAGKNEVFTFENEVFKGEINSKGGTIRNIILKKYKTYQGAPLGMFSPDSSGYALNFSTSDSKIITTDSLYFTPSVKNLTVSGLDSSSISMRVQVAEGKYIEYVYTIKGNAYDIGFKVNMVGMNDVLSPNTRDLGLRWWMTTPNIEKAAKGQEIASTVYYKLKDDAVENLSETEDEKESSSGRVEWVAFKQKFFTSVLIADKPFEKPVDLESKRVDNHPGQIKSMSASLNIPYAHKPSETHAFRFYFGPNHYSTLKKYDIALEKQIPLGWGIFGWVNRFLVIPVFNFLDSFNMNYGLVILILTIVIKVILFPLTYKAYLSQAKMRVLKPEMDEINTKYGEDDPMKKQQAIMTLYRQAGVNPLGGCLPMLLQMPILIALFNFFPSSIELRGKSFLWAEDLSTYDSIWNLPFTIPFYGDHVSLFTLLMTASTIIYTRMNSDMTGSAQMAQMKWMMYLMPIVFLGVLNDYPAALSYYYFLANIITFGQQWMMRRFVNEEEIHRKIQENKKKPVTKSKLQQKLEEMQKKQQQLPHKKK